MLIQNKTWNAIPNERSLPEVHGSVHASAGAGWIKRALIFLGPGFLVAVGYMDPGNWATALAGGAQFGYTLLCVALLSNIVAVMLQSLCVRLGLGAGRDLAQACRDAYPKSVSMPLWLLAELAICATDMAEVIGTAVALNLLFHIPMVIGVCLTACDVFLVLWLQRCGFRWVEALIISFLTLIAGCFLVELFLAKPDPVEIMNGFVPSAQILTQPEMLYLALGIIGATVMPHNLYLHSAIIQTRAVGASYNEKRRAIVFGTIDAVIALTMALVVNASIIILAAAAFNSHGHTDVVTIERAHALLAPVLGNTMAPVLFGVALLLCGISSSVTATMAGQVVMEGFTHWRLKPWQRRLITRGLAIIPVVVVALIYGVEDTGKLLITSQVILSLQLPFAIIPLVLITASTRKMGELRAPRWLTVLCALSGVVLIGLNLQMLWNAL